MDKFIYTDSGESMFCYGGSLLSFPLYSVKLFEVGLVSCKATRDRIIKYACGQKIPRFKRGELGHQSLTWHNCMYYFLPALSLCSFSKGHFETRNIMKKI